MVPANQEQSIVVQIAKNFKNVNVSVPKLKKIAKAVCNRFSIDDKPDTRYEISITIVDDTQIRKVNSRFLNRKTTTDCLSFDLSDDEKKSAIENQSPKIFELVVNGEMAVREAKFAWSFKRGRAGTLHNARLAPQSRIRRLHAVSGQENARYRGWNFTTTWLWFGV